MSLLFLKEGFFRRPSFLARILLRSFSFFFIYLFVVLFFSCSCGKLAKDLSNKGDPLSDKKNDSSWGVVTESAPWVARNGFEALVFKDKIWVLGGKIDKQATDIIWNTSDGTNWQQVTPVGTVWGPRTVFQAVVFNDKMWILGGIDGPQYDDIWNTSDGTNWTKIAPTGDWPGQNARQQVVIFDNKMWMLGRLFVNEILRSDDGVAWTRVAAVNARDGATDYWSARIFHQAAVFDNKMWVVGGDEGGGNNLKDVWSSPDGINWTEHTITNPDWKERKSFKMLPFNNRLLIFGGLTDRGGTTIHYDDVWATTDGEDWKEVSTGASWAARSIFQVVEFKGKLWLMGGLNDRVNFSNDVWVFSKDYFFQ